MTNFFHPNTGDLDPDIEMGCGYMQEMLNGLADGSASGITRWYAERHVEGCPHCAAALTGLKRLRARLQSSGALASFIRSESTPVSNALRHLDPERRSRLEAKWNEIDTIDVNTERLPNDT